MTRALPKTFLERDDARDAAEDVASVQGTTIADRARILEALCRMAAEQIAQHPDPQATLDWEDPLPDESLRLLERLRTERADGTRDSERT